MSEHRMPEYPTTLAQANAFSNDRDKRSCATHLSAFCCLHYRRMSKTLRDSHHGVVDYVSWRGALCGIHILYSQSNMM